MLFKSIFITILCLYFTSSQGQNGQGDVVNGAVSARINNNGSLFWDLVGSAKYLVPKPSTGSDDPDKSPIFMSTLWLGGLDENNDEVTTAQTHLQTGYELKAGPVGNEDKSRVYDKVWELSREEIEWHKENYTRSSYEPIDMIASWPAHGDTTNGESFYLAPFEDVNSDGLYNPKDGDYPRVLGDEITYCIMSEAKEKKYTNDPFMGMEIHLMAYAYQGERNDNTLGQTVFLHYKVYNRSDRDYSDFYLGQFNDFELGYGYDDKVGCNPSEGYSFVYNGDDFDEGTFGYGEVLPMFACVFLNKEMSSHTVVENTRPIGEAMSGKVYDYLSGADLTDKFMFSDDPEKGIGDIDKKAYDKRALSSFGPYDFRSSTSICFNMAFVFAQDVGNVGKPLEHKGLLDEKVKKIKDFYHDNQGACFDTYSSTEEVNPKKEIRIVYANRTLSVEGFEENAEIEVLDLMGRSQMRRTISEGQLLSFNPTASGVYLVKVGANGKRVAKKFYMSASQ